MSLTYFNKLEIINSIKKLDKSQQLSLFKFINTTFNSKYSTNRNGTFINFNTLSDNNFLKIKNYLESHKIDNGTIQQTNDNRNQELNKMISSLNKNEIIEEIVNIKIQSNNLNTKQIKKFTHSERQLKIWNKYKDDDDPSDEIDVDKLINNYIKYKTIH